MFAEASTVSFWERLSDLEWVIGAACSAVVLSNLIKFISTFQSLISIRKDLKASAKLDFEIEQARRKLPSTVQIRIADDFAVQKYDPKIREIVGKIESNSGFTRFCLSNSTDTSEPPGHTAGDDRDIGPWLLAVAMGTLIFLVASNLQAKFYRA